MRRIAPIQLAALMAGVVSCDPGVLPHEDKPTTLVVTPLPGFRTGCAGDGPLLEFNEDLAFSVEALDALGQTYPYTGPVAIRMTPGRLDNPFVRYTMQQGFLPSAPVAVRLAHGTRAHVWAELVGEGGRSATGVSPDLCFQTPRIADVQCADSSHQSNFDGEQVVIRGDRLVATSTDSKGFYVTDLDAEECASLYVFTFGEPTGVKPGSCMCEVSGGIKEFLHFTEVVFPTWRVYKPGGSVPRQPTCRRSGCGSAMTRCPTPGTTSRSSSRSATAARASTRPCGLHTWQIAR